jgi:integrase
VSPRRRTRDTDLPACVYRRHGAYWLVKRGKWRRLGADLRTALAAYASAIESLSAMPAENGAGLARLIDEVMPELVRGKSRNTTKNYMLSARTLRRAFIEFEPEDVRPKDVAKFKQSLSRTPALANRALTVLRLVMAYAVEHELVERNPVVDIPRYRELPRKRLLTPGEYLAIRACASERLQIIMDLCIRTGQRIGDVLAIKRVDLLEEGIRFAQQKTGAREVVKWTPELRAIVERAKTLHGNLRALTLLHSARGKQLAYWQASEHWVRARKRAGVPDARLHDLRAFAATHARKQGKDAQALLGHTSMQQTRRYLRGRDEPLVEGPSFEGVLDSEPGRAS